MDTAPLDGAAAMGTITALAMINCARSPISSAVKLDKSRSASSRIIKAVPPTALVAVAAVVSIAVAVVVAVMVVVVVVVSVVVVSVVVVVDVVQVPHTVGQ